MRLASLCRAGAAVLDEEVAASDNRASSHAEWLPSCGWCYGGALSLIMPEMLSLMVLRPPARAFLIHFGSFLDAVSLRFLIFFTYLASPLPIMLSIPTTLGNIG